jgi:hypothetical protein
VPKRNFGFEKRQKEMDKRRKRDEKRQRKLDRANKPPDSVQPDGVTLADRPHETDAKAE